MALLILQLRTECLWGVESSQVCPVMHNGAYRLEQLWESQGQPWINLCRVVAQLPDVYDIVYLVLSQTIVAYPRAFGHDIDRKNSKTTTTRWRYDSEIDQIDNEIDDIDDGIHATKNRTQKTRHTKTQKTTQKTSCRRQQKHKTHKNDTKVNNNNKNTSYTALHEHNENNKNAKNQNRKKTKIAPGTVSSKSSIFQNRVISG